VWIIPALTFVPISDVVSAFEDLQDDFGTDLTELIDYFEDTYIGRPKRNQK
ncbi:hypothetical protein QYM36_007191, partial [Artemia franciscana]